MRTASVLQRTTRQKKNTYELSRATTGESTKGTLARAISPQILYPNSLSPKSISDNPPEALGRSYSSQRRADRILPGRCPTSPASDTALLLSANFPVFHGTPNTCNPSPPPKTCSVHMPATGIVQWLSKQIPCHSFGYPNDSKAKYTLLREQRCDLKALRLEALVQLRELSFSLSRTPKCPSHSARSSAPSKTNSIRPIVGLG